MDSLKLRATVISKSPLHEGFLKMYRYRLSVQRHDGTTRAIDWELMERGNAVGVLAYDPRLDAVVIGNECRPGALVSGDYPYRDQIIAGTLDADESPLDAAVREMREETGLLLRDPRLIHAGAYVSSGGTTEKLALIFGLVDAGGAAGAIHGDDANEDVLTVVVPAPQFIARVLSGEIDDMKTLVAGYWFVRGWPGLRG